MNSIKTKTECGVEWRNSKGKLHREIGPALVDNAGTKYWCINGILHREFGAAVIRRNGNHDYYLNGVFYSEQEYKQEIVKRNLKKLEV